jgi:hypothetical protein
MTVPFAASDRGKSADTPVLLSGTYVYTCLWITRTQLNKDNLNRHSHVGFLLGDPSPFKEVMDLHQVFDTTGVRTRSNCFAFFNTGKVRFDHWFANRLKSSMSYKRFRSNFYRRIP